jgi:hypothetical protein
MIFSRAGFNALKFAYIVLLAGIGVGAFLVVGSYLYWQSEKKNDQLSQSALQDIRGRLNNATRDRDDLRGSEDTYKALSARGLFLNEERLDLIEALAALKSRHQLLSLTYEVAPQRPLRLTGNTYSGVNLVASRIKLKVRAFHDADLVAFLDEFPRMQRGFFPIDRCTIRRGAAAAVVVAASAPAEEDDGTATAPRTRPAPATAAPYSPPVNTATLEAECSLEWITLRSKDGKSSAAAPNPRPL